MVVAVFGSGLGGGEEAGEERGPAISSRAPRRNGAASIYVAEFVATSMVTVLPLGT